MSIPGRTRGNFRLSRKLLLRLMAAAAVVVLLGFSLRASLVHRMMLPRLILNQGGSVIAVAISPDGKTIFSGSDPTHDAMRSRNNKAADVFVWDAASGKVLHTLHEFYWRSNAVAISSDGRQVIAAGYVDRDAASQSSKMTPNKIVAWDWQSEQKIWTIDGDMPLTFSPNGRLIGCADGIREFGTNKLVIKIPGGLQPDSQIEFSTDGTFFGFIGRPTLNKSGFMESGTGGRSSYSTTRLHLWRTDTVKEVKDFPFTRIRAFDIARNGLWVVTVGDPPDGMTGGTDGGIVRRVDIKSGVVAWTRKRSYNAPDHDPDAALNSVVISPNGKYIVTQSLSNQLIVLNAATGRELFRPLQSQTNIGGAWAISGGIAFSSDGKTLVSRCGPQLLVWDTSRLQ